MKLKSAVAALFALAVLVMAQGLGAAGPHDSTVPEAARRDLPRALDGRTYAGTRVGDRILVGGSFTEVEDTTTGEIVQQPYLFSYDINTGQMDRAFAPILDKEVLDLLPGPDGDSVYVAGKFNNVNGVARSKVVLLNLEDGSVRTEFKANAWGAVNSIERYGDRLFIGGAFQVVNGVSRGNLAEVDANTGVVKADFDIPLTGDLARNAAPVGPRYLGITPDGNTLVVVHRSKFVDGFERRGIAMIDISNPQAPNVLPWRTYDYDIGADVRIMDAALSPDGTYVVTVHNGADGPPMRDTAVRYEVSGGDGVTATWVTRNFDSTFAVGISDSAVYIGGHFCYTESTLAPDPWPGDTDRDHSCYGSSNAGQWGDQVVFRDQIAALDPITGHALDWDPGSDAFNGVRSLEVIDRGLLVGHDGTWLGGARTYHHGFFDFNGAGAAPNPTTNLALAGTATQSSTLNGGVASRAIDGSSNGRFNEGSVTRTSSDSEAWWEVDLGQVSSIQRLLVYSRTDWRTDRLRDASVFVSDAPFESTSVSATRQQPGVTEFRYDGVLEFPTSVDVGRTGRYVRVQRRDGERLELAEVLVFETPVIVEVDRTPPSVSVVAPVANTVVAADASISGVAVDDVSVAAIRIGVRERDTKQWLHVDGTFGSWVKLEIPVDNPGNASSSWYLPQPIPAGRYVAYVWAVDTAGNVTATKLSHKFVVEDAVTDFVAPETSFTSPETGGVVGSPMVVSGEASDDQGLDYMRVRVLDRVTRQWLHLDGTFGSWTVLNIPVDAPGSTTSSFSLPAIAPAGEYRVWIEAVDEAGNLQETATFLKLTVTG